jgi:uncharacterized repeat protein (TIGR01451 family)
VSGNKIGTDAAGAAAIANLDGVLIQSGARGNIVGTDGDGSGDAAEANLISGNARFGVNIREDSTDGNRVSGNRIGTDFNGTADLGNTLDGVLISLGATGNTIGGTAAGAGNVIAFNAKGVVVGTDAADGAAGNTITRNRIFANAGPGIDLGDDDVTPNDAADPDPGPNLLQNFPVLTAATSTTVGGTLNSTPGRTFVLEFFAGGAAAGQGQTFLGSTTVTTDATTGDAAFTATLGSAIPPNQFVTATATDTTTGDTSEFSAGFSASANLAVTMTAAPERLLVGQELTYTIVVTNNGPNTATGVIVTDTLTAGAAFVTVTTTQGTASESGGVVTSTLGNLASGATATVTITVRPAAAGTLSNTASVAGQQPDPNPGNNTTQPVVTPVDPAVANLTVTVTAVPDRVVVGQELTYTIVVTNGGPNTATGVIVTDTLTAGAAFVTATTTQGAVSESGGVVTATLGTLAPGATATVTIIVQPTAAGSLTNVARVAGDQPNSDPANGVSAPVVTPVDPVAGPPVTVLALQRFGFHAQATRLVLTFSAALDPASAQDLRNYTLTALVHGGRRLPLRLAGASYDPASNAVTLRPARLLPLRLRYELVVSGTPPGGVRDASGRLIDGNGDGQPGSNFVRVFGRGILAGPSRPAAPGRGHRGPVSPAIGGPGGALSPSAVDAVLGAIAVRQRRW